MLDIQLKSVSKTYSGSKKPVVQDLSIDVEKGSIVTLLGPSGCGKTTTLRMIAGFERIDKGSISLSGQIVNDRSTWVPPENRGIGMVFQDLALFPHLNVFDNVSFGYKEIDKKNRGLEVLKLVNLEGYEKRYIHELSGGQLQRVALARALARKPSIVLLDEPFSSLDADLRVSMRVEVKRIIKESGATAIFVSHDQKDALAISDRIIVMKDGVVQQNGTPREIYQYPENKFVASFVGQSNLLEGVIHKNGKSVITVIGLVPCEHTHCKRPFEKVCISIRPDSLELADDGDIIGIIKECTYTGASIDSIVEIMSHEGKPQKLLVHVHPEKDVNVGDEVRFKVLPNFVAVVKTNNIMKSSQQSTE